MTVAGLIRVMALYLVRKLKKLYNVTISRILLQKKLYTVARHPQNIEKKKYDTTQKLRHFF